MLNQPMTIVSAADEGFAAHFAAMLHSAWTHHPTAEFYLLDCGLKPGTLADLRDFATKQGICLNIISIDPTVLRDLPTTKALSIAAYARLLIPDFFPDSVERALYIDADCIVVDDLMALWRLDMGKAALAAVHDPGGAQMEREIGINLDEEGYVNSGVMLMNLIVWRHEELATAAMAFSKKHSPHACDQPGINVACAGRIAYLPEQWNFQLQKPRRPAQWLEPSIIHYAGPKKPWIYSDVLFASIYLYHRNQTPFVIEPPRTPYRSPLRKMINLLIGRRKYWDRFIIARRSQAFATVYFNRIARAGTSSRGSALVSLSGGEQPQVLG
jgi:lipopolysaccharide biosynthesis glycosyltransferase